VRCGNDPNEELTPGDRAVVGWFAEWLAWSRRRDNGEDAGPEPACPDGRAMDIAARAQDTKCDLSREGEST
jgi:hypothetical protein